MTVKQLTDNIYGGDFSHLPSGRIDLFPNFPDHIDVVQLSTVSTTYTIPAGSRFLIFSAESGVDYAIKANGPATFPASGVTNGSGSFLNMTQCDVTGISSLGIISDTNGFLTIAVFG